MGSLGAPRGCRNNSGSRELTRACLGVVGLIRVRVGSLGRVVGSSGSFGFACVHSGAISGRPIHPGSRWFTPARHGVVGFFGLARVIFDSLGFAWVHL